MVLFESLHIEFYYPSQKSKEYKKLRQEVTNEYGDITLILTLAFLTLIPIFGVLNQRFVAVSEKLQFFRSINASLNRWMGSEKVDGGEISFKAKVKRFLATRAKNVLIFLVYNSRSLLLFVFLFLIMSLLSLSDINNGDLIFVAKRVGKIPAVCFPTILFLSLRPSPLPHTLYLALLPLHKWLSRIIILQTLLHVALFCGFFQHNGTWEKAWKKDNMYGWVPFIGFAIIFITSLLKFKNKFYRFFYFQHYLWTWIIAICLQFHIRPVKYSSYTAVNISILITQIVYRIRLLQKTTNAFDVQVTDVTPALQLVELPNHLITNKALNPGAHIRVTEYNSSFIVRAFKQVIPYYHPYTLASLPLDTTQKLIIRTGKFRFLNRHRYLAAGSYDSELSFTESKNANSKFSIAKLKVKAKRILIIVGGTGISFALPILRILNYHGIPIKIVWVVHDYREIAVLKWFDGFIHGDDFEIFVTGSSSENNNSANNSAKIDRNMSHIYTREEFDLNQQDETLPLLNDNIGDVASSDNYDENVEISMENEDPADDNDCEEMCIEDLSDSDVVNDMDEEVPDALESLSPSIGDSPSNKFASSRKSISRKTSLSRRTNLSKKSSVSTANEVFTPTLTSSSENAYRQLQRFKDIIRSLNIEHKIYKGRPKINYRYYNWCLYGGFTQCSGPVEGSDRNIVCCRDLVKPDSIQLPLKDIWVISAGPEGLVKNVKVWVQETGFNFHEESFKT